MKKEVIDRVRRISYAILLSCMTIFITLSLTACKTGLEKNNEIISEIRNGYFTASDDVFVVTAISGKREEPFKIDGLSGEKKEYTLVTIEPKNYVLSDAFDYKIVCGEQEFNGKFVPHPFASSWSAEIPVATKSDFLLTVTGSKSGEYTLASVLDANMIDEAKAFDIAYTRLKQSIKNFNGQSYEVFVRFVSNPINNTGGYYWYVAFVNPDLTLAALIDPASMEITALRD